MVEFWEALSVLSKVYFVIAIIASSILVIQVILLIIGFVGGGLGDTDTDFDDIDDGAGLFAGFFTIKGFVAFFSIGSWVGLAMDSASVHVAATIIVSLLCGAAAMVGIGFLMRFIYSLQTSGNLEIENAVGKFGEVYLTIPANESGTGKVTAIVQDQSVELEARTLSPHPIKTGSPVKITSHVGNIVLVEPVNPNN